MINRRISNEKRLTRNVVVKSRLVTTTISGFIWVLLSLHGAGQAWANDTTYRLASGQRSGNYHPIAVALTTLLKLKRTGQDDIFVEAVETGGSTDNMHALLRGEVDIAFVDTATIMATLTKAPPFDKYTNSNTIRSVAGLWQSVAHLIINDIFLQDGTLNDFRNLAGKTVSFGSSKSSSSTAARQIFTKNGFYYDKIFNIPNLTGNQSIDAFTNELIEGLAYFTYVGEQSIHEMLSEPENNSALLSISDSQLEKLNDGEMQIWERYTITTSQYPGLSDDVETVAQRNYLVVRSDFPSSDAHYLTRTIFENLTFINVIHPATRQIKNNNHINHSIIPHHHGATRYFIEEASCKTLLCLFE